MSDLYSELTQGCALHAWTYDATVTRAAALADRHADPIAAGCGSEPQRKERLLGVSLRLDLSQSGSPEQPSLAAPVTERDR